MFQGSMVALATPMHADGSLDWPALDRLLEFHIEAGTDAIVAVGTTGESATLDFDEHCEAVAYTVKTVAGRLPVIAGTGSNSTREAIELTRCAKEAGADAALLVSPYYNKPTQEGLYLHHKAVAEAVELPQILYNVPGRTAVDMLPETVERLAEIPNIIGIKEATASNERTAELVERVGGRFDLYSGDDGNGLAFLLAGGQGIISVTANVAPRLMAAMCRAVREGRPDEAREINRRLDGLHSALFLEANPIPVKWALQRMGLIGEGIRLPLTPLSEPFHPPVLDAMRQAGIEV